MDKIIKFLEELMEPVFEWIKLNHTNPILWISLFFIGLGVFNFTYNALKKEN